MSKTERLNWLVICGRVSCYICAVFGCMWVSETFFGNTYTASLSVFVILAAMIEMMWNVSYKQCNWRIAAYIVSVLALGAFGIIQAQQAYEFKSDKFPNTIRARIEGVVRSVDGPMIATDERGNICAVSKEFEELVGYNRDELLGKSISILFSKEDSLRRLEIRKVIFRQLHQLDSPGWVIRGRERLVFKKRDGGTVNAEVYTFAVRYSIHEGFPSDIHYVNIVSSK